MELRELTTVRALKRLRERVDARRELCDACSERKAVSVLSIGIPQSERAMARIVCLDCLPGELAGFTQAVQEVAEQFNARYELTSGPLLERP